VNYGIIQRHGGVLTIDSEEGQGTTVTFRLPAATPILRREAVAVGPAPRPRLRVLLIDDDEGVRTVVRDMLVEDGHEVLQAPDGPAGLALLDGDERVALVLTDLGMLGMNGWDVARAVKASYPATVVGLITGWDEGFGPKPVGPIQADLIVRKPVTQEALRSVIARAQELGAVRS
jgi:CheY-like chemotaxis protein